MLFLSVISLNALFLSIHPAQRAFLVDCQSHPWVCWYLLNDAKLSLYSKLWLWDNYGCSITLLIGYIIGCLFSSVFKVFDNLLHVYTLQGHDTVSSALGFCTHLLGVHTDVQKKCQQELDQIMGMYALWSSLFPIWCYFTSNSKDQRETQ